MAKKNSWGHLGLPTWYEDVSIIGRAETGGKPNVEDLFVPRHGAKLALVFISLQFYRLILWRCEVGALAQKPIPFLGQCHTWVCGMTERTTGSSWQRPTPNRLTASLGAQCSCSHELLGARLSCVCVLFTLLAPFHSKAVFHAHTWKFLSLTFFLLLLCYSQHHVSLLVQHVRLAN